MITARSVALGIILGAALCLLSDYSSFYLHNTLLIGNHMPLAALLCLFLMSVLLNPLLRMTKPSWAFRSSELMLVFTLIILAGAFAETSLWRYLPSYLGSPSYYASEENGYARYLLAHLKPSLVLASPEQQGAVQGYFEGLSADQPVPWSVWLRPLAAWFPFFGGFLLSSLGLSLLFSRQWSQRERFVFPLVLLPSEAAQDPEEGKYWGPLYRQPVFWLFFALPVLIWGFNDLGLFIHGLPKIPMSWSTLGWFTNKPWDQFHMQTANIYFTVIGISFLLTKEISFSVWFFFFLYRLSFVVLAAFDLPSTKFFGQWGDKVASHQGAGAFLTLGLFTFYVARAHLKAVWNSALGRDDGSSGLGPWASRLVLASCLLGPLLMLAWYLDAGLRWIWALASVILFLCICLVTTRLISEAGLILLGTGAGPFDSLLGLAKGSILDPRATALLAVQKGVIMEDYRQSLMPYLANSLKSFSMALIKPKKALPLILAALALGFVLAGVGTLGTSYKYGAVNMDDWSAKAGPEYFLGKASTFLRGEQAPPPALQNAGHMLIGAAGTGLLLFLRGRFVWWPLHPYGWLICTTYATWMIWFSVFLGWLAKTLALGLGGPSVYRKLVPGFIGFVIGEAFIGGLAALISLLTGMPGISILP